MFILCIYSVTECQNFKMAALKPKVFVSLIAVGKMLDTLLELTKLHDNIKKSHTNLLVLVESSLLSHVKAEI